jgi:DNA-binding NtrC family response regulator
MVDQEPRTILLTREPGQEPSAAAKTSAVRRIGEEAEFLYLPSSQLAKLFDQIQAVAPQDTTVLLTGETGTGKTRLARVIHALSPRRADPFVVVDCGSLSGSIIESELFGHVKGAFTGGDTNRVGKFADAEQGTLLLDEIDSLPLGLQSKLLRVVEERVFEPVGSNRSAPMRARLIVAANRPLEQEVAAGRFRSDLYFRLNVVRFNLPPLRESRGLISDLALKFVHEFRVQHNRLADAITTEALHALEQYPWPGNVRELRNVIQRATILCPCQKIRLDDLPESLRRSDTAVGDNTPGPTLAQIRRDAEIGSIVHVLRKHNNNRRRAALELGISRVALYKKLRKYGMMVRKPPKSASHAQSIPA